MLMPPPALPRGSLVLVTGASGYIASHIIREALSIGYRVRGASRTADSCQKTEALVESPRYETVVVANMSIDNAFDEAVNGVDGIIHTASVLSMSPDPNEVIPQTIAGSINVLKSAMKEESVKRVVYTSSSVAATLPSPNEKKVINKDTWNDFAVELAWSPPPYHADRAYAVYAASKTEAERAVWRFVAEEKPGFVVNCVNPYANFGRILSSPGPTGFWIPGLVNGKAPVEFPPQWMIDVIDNARIHLAALLDPDLSNERIFAFAHPYNFNTLIRATRNVRPDLKLAFTHVDQGEDIMDPDNKLGSELLRRWFGQDGYKSLEQTVKENLEGV